MPTAVPTEVPQSPGVEPGCVWLLLPTWVVISVVSFVMGGGIRRERLILDLVFCTLLLGAGLYATWQRRRFPPATLSYELRPAPGEDFTGRITAPLPAGHTTQVRLHIALICGLSRSRRALWESDVEAQAYEGEVTFTTHIPARLEHESATDCRWSVDLRARVGRIPYRATFDLR